MNPTNEDARVATRLFLVAGPRSRRVEDYRGLGFAGLQKLRVGDGCRRRRGLLRHVTQSWHASDRSDADCVWLKKKNEGNKVQWG